MIEVLQIIILIGLLLTAILAVLQTDLLHAAVTLGAFSFLLALEFYILQAPDVAIAEAGIGAALTTAIFIFAIRAVGRKEVTS
ncbi:MAG: DUF4040 domain-containing protein [Methanospirillaceae archaeon]|nr:DUF4040 domain-containing protein [Methanospirillaceae archaeon]